MNHILFSHSYFMRYDPKQWATAQPYPPLATIGAAALMREHGFGVSLFDTMFVEQAGRGGATAGFGAAGFFRRL